MKLSKEYRPTLTNELCTDLVKRLSNVADLSREERMFLTRLEDRLQVVEAMEVLATRRSEAAQALQEAINNGS